MKLFSKLAVALALVAGALVVSAAPAAASTTVTVRHNRCIVDFTTGILYGHRYAHAAAPNTLDACTVRVCIMNWQGGKICDTRLLSRWNGQSILVYFAPGTDYRGASVCLIDGSPLPKQFNQNGTFQANSCVN